MAKRPVPRFPAGVTAAIAYCHAVLDGTVVACQIVHRACSRFVEELDAAEAGQGPWAFCPNLAERAMIFAGLMRNIRGPEAGQLLRLMAWQQFVFANLFGFVERGTDTRRFR